MVSPVPQATHTRKTPFVKAARREVFIARLSECGQVSVAARASGTDRSVLYKERKRNLEFAEQWTEALRIAITVAEDELYRRGVDGWEEPIYHQGKPVGIIRRFSDSNLQFFLKAADPAKYRENYRGTEGTDIDLDTWTQDTT